jgi:predicted PurR-regulated permease PerM
LVVFGFSIWLSVLEVSKNADDYRKRVRVLVLEMGDLVPTAFSRHDRQPVRSRLKDWDSLETATESGGSVVADASGSPLATTGRDPNVSDGSPPPQTAPSETTATAAEVPLTGRSSNTSVGDDDLSADADDLSADADDLSADADDQAKLDRASELVDSILRDGIASLSQTLIGLVSTSVVVLIYVFFLLLGTPSVAKSPAVREIDIQVRSYLSLKTVISIFTGLAFGLTLRLFGVPMALTFGVLAFLLNFVPNVGPLVASLLPVPLIILDPEGSVGWMIATITAISLIQMISGNVVEPKIMGDSSGLHPVTILLALMFWGMMWGVIGMFLATPITAALKIMLDRFESTHWMSNLMAGRWDESPSETAASATV